MDLGSEKSKPLLEHVVIADYLDSEHKTYDDDKCKDNDKNKEKGKETSNSNENSSEHPDY